jgi:hypothetical protein
MWAGLLFCELDHFSIMKKALYLDFSIPVFVDKIALEHYMSSLRLVIKSLEKTSHIHFYFSLNLFNEVLLNKDFEDLQKLIKTMLEQDRAEIVASTTFNISSNSKENLITSDFLYSEYFNGFSFGDKRDFEGDPVLMLKNCTTAFFNQGKPTEQSLEAFKLLGYSRLFVDKNLITNFTIYHSLRMIPADLSLSTMFKEFITSDSVINFLQHSFSPVLYLNVFDTYIHTKENFDSNFGNLIYLLDRNNPEIWKLVDLDDENIEYSKNLNSEILYELHTENMNNSDISALKNNLSVFLKLETSYLGSLEDFKNIAIWKKSGNAQVDAQNMFNLLLMTILSEMINRENLLLNNHLSSHVNDIINRLEVMGSSSKEFISLISTLKDKINQK